MSAVRKSTGTTKVAGQDHFARGGSNSGRRVCVVGGGIGGLTAALAFARTGAQITVHEQAPQIEEVGAGIQITPNGARALDALGLGAAMAAQGIAAEALEPMDAATGRALARFALNDLEGPPYRFFHRADLIGLLATACSAAGVEVVLGSRADASSMEGDVIVAAEGIHSPTRAVLNGPAEPFFTGQVAWRAIVDAPGADPVARVWMAPGRHAVTYPLPGGRLNIVAVQERQQWAAEGWAHADDPGNLRHAFRATSGLLRGQLDRVEAVHLWGLFRHPVAQVWARGPLALLGDAAHPTLPFLAQGANLAIEDAYVLAQACDQNLDVAQAVQSYAARRKPRVSRAIAAANANARKYHLAGPARSFAHTGLRTIGKIAPQQFLKRLDWLYGHDVTT